MTRPNRQNLFSGILFMAFGIFMLASSAGIEVKHQGGDMGSALFPYIISGLLSICGAIVILTYLVQQRRFRVSGKQTEAPRKEQGEILKEKDGLPEENGFKNRRSVVFGFAAFVLYAVLLKPLGFVLSSILFLTALMNIMSPERPDKKKEVLWVAISVVIPIVVFAVFVYLLNVTLPMGIFK